MALAGNFLAYNVESVETDASGWLAGTNATIAQSTAHALDGTHSLAITATASGAASAFVANRVQSVVAGTLYASYFWMYTTVANIATYEAVDWYNASNTYISTTTGPTVNIPANVWTQVGAPMIAVATATQSVPIINLTATAASQVFYADEMYFGPWTPIRDLTIGQAVRRAAHF